MLSTACPESPCGFQGVTQALGNSRCLSAPGQPPLLPQIRLKTCGLHFACTFQNHEVPHMANLAMSLPAESLQWEPSCPQSFTWWCFQPCLPPLPPLQTQPPHLGPFSCLRAFARGVLPSFLIPDPLPLIVQTLNQQSLPPGSLPDVSTKLKAPITYVPRTMTPSF